MFIKNYHTVNYCNSKQQFHSNFFVPNKCFSLRIIVTTILIWNIDSLLSFIVIQYHLWFYFWVTLSIYFSWILKSVSVTRILYYNMYHAWFMDYWVHTVLYANVCNVCNVSPCTTYWSCKLKIILDYIYHTKDIQLTLVRKNAFKIDLLKWTRERY